LNTGVAGGVACTMEAKQCPDGSYVGRVGPNCEFASCPATSGHTVTFFCSDARSVVATFYPGNDTHVDLVLSDGRTLSVPHAMSGSGARYANADESFVFWNKGDAAFITENGTTTYADCSTLDTSSWKSMTDPDSGVTFRYPGDFGTKYISTVDWPPKVAVQNGPFTCTAAGSETARAGITQPVALNGRVYCVTKESEGAAGSVYTNYAYAAERGSTVLIFTFSLRFVQCANYDEPKRTECTTERNAFTPDTIMDAVAQSASVQ
jgi:membrane-bound inhibitor of C-type lysozyme